MQPCFFNLHRRKQALKMWAVSKVRETEAEPEMG